ncbi:nitrate ABC transporter substrate-binding protein [Pandoraea terrae]|uniref:Nitrate ABC transporter substrate-binding protein n=1 Tax=Pandoraea terrae TaxID=1537710 RepID=A0A5E4TKC7_9BURK|nr:nitrate ABC transporter substrate-binding protein [Pandoraea terrae]
MEKLTPAFVRSRDYIRTHSAEEIAAQMPVDYYAGNKALYIKALAASRQMFTADGKMPADGPETVLKVLATFDPAIKRRPLDLSRTYTNDFVTSVKRQQASVSSPEGMR